MLGIGQHDFDPTHNLGRSLTIDLDGIPIVCARVTATQNAEVDWDCHDEAGRPVASGVYFYRLTARGVDLRKKMVLLK